MLSVRGQLPKQRKLVERWKQLLLRQIACRPKDHHCERHGHQSLMVGQVGLLKPEALRQRAAAVLASQALLHALILSRRRGLPLRHPPADFGDDTGCWRARGAAIWKQTAAKLPTALMKDDKTSTQEEAGRTRQDLSDEGLDPRAPQHCHAGSACPQAFHKSLLS